MTNLSTLPPEVIGLVVKQLVLHEQRSEVQLVGCIWLDHARRHPILSTCRSVRKAALQGYPLLGRFFIKSQGIDALDSTESPEKKTFATKKIIGDCDDEKMLLFSSELFTNLTFLEWDLRDSKEGFGHESVFRTWRFFTAHALKSDPMKMFMSTVVMSNWYGSLDSIFADCRSLRSQVQTIHVKFKVSLGIQCPANPSVKHICEADYSWKLNDLETLQMDGNPTWIRQGTAVGLAGCECEAKLMN